MRRLRAQSEHKRRRYDPSAESAIRPQWATCHAAASSDASGGDGGGWYAAPAYYSSRVPIAVKCRSLIHRGPLPCCRYTARVTEAPDCRPGDAPSCSSCVIIICPLLGLNCLFDNTCG